jgi:hypothetical protein
MGITKKWIYNGHYSSGNIMEIYRIYSGIVVFEEDTRDVDVVPEKIASSIGN